jgi:hypothetical protein
MVHAIVSRKKEQDIYKRKDSRMSFAKNHLLTARCETIDSKFSVSVQDLSPSGAFIYTQKKLRPGQEIAMTINLPESDEFLMVTGEIVRTSSEGYGVKFIIIFNE